jgi:NHL repeat
MTNKLFGFVLGIFFCLGLCPAGEADPSLASKVTFTSKPKVSKAGGQVKIRFTVSAPIDVEVSILGAKGQIVRRLAAGVLGNNAPEPFKKGLTQELTWDGRDDAGKKVKATKVRVSLGMTGRLHRVYGGDPQHFTQTSGMSVGPDGTLYCMSQAGLYGHRTTWWVNAFAGDGKHLRQVFPGPAGLPEEKRQGWPRIKLDDGNEVPVVWQLLSRSTYPGAVFQGRNFSVVTKDQRLILLSAPGGGGIKHPDVRGGRRLMILGTDGSVPANWMGPVVCPVVGGFGQLALSPDEKYVYVTGLVSTGKKGKGPQNVVYRVALAGAGKSEVLIGGQLYAKGEGKEVLSDPQGIATDKDGNIYVGDYDHNRIAVFSSAGKYLDEIPCQRPDTVMVSKKTGAIYVMTIKERKKPFTNAHYYVPAHNWYADKVIKFAGLKDKTQKAVFQNVSRNKMGAGAYMALDDSGETTLLWVAGLDRGRDKIRKLLDKGASLELANSPISEASKASKSTSLPLIGDAAYLGGKLLTNFPSFGGFTGNRVAVFDVESGKPEKNWVARRVDGKKAENVWTLLYGEMISGADGNMYARTGSGNVLRYAPDGKQLPFASREGKNFITDYHHSHTRQAGLFIDRSGTMYLPCELHDRVKLAAMDPKARKKLGLGRKLREMTVSVAGADGKYLREAVSVFNARMGGIAVDSRGNIYLGAQAVLKAQRLPKWVDGKLPADSPAHHPSNDYKQNATVFKFPASGGGIVADAEGLWTAIAQYKRESVSIKKALWTKRLGYVGSHGKELGCHCETTRFDIDGYDRLMVPDIFRFRVYVLDTNGNQITHFGSYGNMDSRGPDSAVPTPKIPFGWPLSVECGGDKAFITDTVNKRVVGVKFEFAVSEEAAIK